MEEQRRAAYRNSRLGQILITKGYISEEQLDAAIHRSESHDQLLGEYLIRRRMISRWQLRRALSTQSQRRLFRFPVIGAAHSGLPTVGERRC